MFTKLFFKDIPECLQSCTEDECDDIYDLFKYSKDFSLAESELVRKFPHLDVSIITDILKYFSERQVKFKKKKNSFSFECLLISFFPIDSPARYLYKKIPGE